MEHRLQLNLGLRYEVDTDVNNQSRVDELNPIVLLLVTDERQRDLNNFGPRVGFAWNATDNGSLIRGGYGLYYDRIVLQVQSLERGLDGRALPIEVRAGNVFFLDQATERFPAFAPKRSTPFSGFVLSGAGASGINIIDPHLQNPSVHEFHLGAEQQIRGIRARVDVMHNQGIAAPTCLRHGASTIHSMRSTCACRVRFLSASDSASIQWSKWSISSTRRTFLESPT